MAGGAGALSLGKLEQVVLGEPARVAAELQSSAARGEILVSRLVAERLRESHVFEPVPAGAYPSAPVGAARRGRAARHGASFELDLAPPRTTSNTTTRRICPG